MAYAVAHRAQLEHVEEVLASRDAGVPEVGRLLLVEHDPVITVTRRAGAHLRATPARLTEAGVAIAETDRGGDITYHGPGQLVAYPILDLNLLGLGLHAYMRLLEDAVIGVCGALGFEAGREQGATGVWMPQAGAPASKVCAMGVRVRRWVSMHGLALNVTTNLDHFRLIVPCGLVGRQVTSLEREAAARRRPCPAMSAAKRELIRALSAAVDAALSRKAGASEAASGL